MAAHLIYVWPPSSLLSGCIVALRVAAPFPAHHCAPLPRSSRRTEVKLHKLGAHSAPGAAGQPRPAGSAEFPEIPLAPPPAAGSPVLLCSFPGSLGGLLCLA